MIKHYSLAMPTKVDHYYEPFFGGGAMLLHVVQNYAPKSITVNDINSDIVNIYCSIRDNLAVFTKTLDELEKQFLCMDYAGRKAFYYEIRHRHAWETFASSAEKAATLYFLLRTGFNGLWLLRQKCNNTYGTACGALTQTTSIYNRNVVKTWHSILTANTITIKSGDWSEAIPKQLEENSFIFLDPPYRGSIADYGQERGDEMQKAILDFTKNVPNHSRVILCNDEIGDGFFENLPNNLEKSFIEVSHSAGRKRKEATELFIYNKSN
jgi:DNA adenine methylase